MSEEQEQSNDGTLSGLKKTVIGVITTAVMGLGTWGVTQITGAGAAAGAASLSPPPNNVDNQTPPAVTTVPATPIIVFFKPDQVPSCSCSSDIVFVFIF